jgi:hypothetical protein
MLLKFSEGLVQTKKFDVEAAHLADRHYSRQKVGAAQFMPPGRTIILRSHEGDVLFGWLWQSKRDDGESGYNCSIFRNESQRLSSDIVREAERLVVGLWGPARGFTYIDPFQVGNGKVEFNPGYCFKCAGWRFVRVTTSGLHLLEKLVLGA